MDVVTPLALSVVLSAVAFYLLYLVVRAAVLSALRAHDQEKASGGAAPHTAQHRGERQE